MSVFSANTENKDNSEYAHFLRSANDFCLNVNVTFLCLIVGGQIANFGEKNPQVHLIIIKK